jgi:alkyl sulfatase BDS1-like metallo-beta-lactamase superfamily hydrolase
MAPTPDLTPKPATAHTCACHSASCSHLPLGDRTDFDDASRGLIASLPDVTIRTEKGQLVWSLGEYAFLSASEVPDSVNPSLWRQAQLNMNHGLFQVTDRIYQVRGFDISNMTLIEGNRGVIVIDPLISCECARAALDLYYAHRGHKPVTAVIYTHSHTDHYGGVRGVVNEADVIAGLVPIIAPDKFLEEVTKENVLIGTPMIRRAIYQFGPMLPKGPRGQVDAGLGKVTSRGTVSLIPPTQVIVQPVEVHIVDGIEIVFQLTPDTEAPAEMHMFYPGLKALNLAENATHNLHNIYPLRGTQVRDCNAWAKYLGDALVQFAPKSEVVFAQHHWPVWSNAKVTDFLTKQRDTYKYLHDQTLRLMNHGYKAAEIAERMALPASLETNFASRGYYGTLSHNSKSVYQRYIGWYDGNPANLAPLPPVQRAEKLVAYMGGAAAALVKAREDFANGEYRWVAEIANTIVFSDPTNQEARTLCADAFEQLGYQAESATWRNAYLQGAQELRHGAPKMLRAPVREDFVRALPVGQVFDYLAIRIDPAKSAGRRAVINWSFTDLKETYVLTLENCALSYVSRHQAADADVTVTLVKPVLTRLMLRQGTLIDAVKAGTAAVTGDASKLAGLFAMIEDFPLGFPIVEPLQGSGPI